MPKKKAASTFVSRAVYDPTIREVIAEGDLGRMKRVLKQANEILNAQGDLKGAIKRLEKAIASQEKAE